MEQTPSVPSVPSAIASETLPDDTELDWGTWGKRWRGGWDDEAPKVADLEEVAASGAETDVGLVGLVGGGAGFGLSLDQVAGDCRGEYVPLHPHVSTGGLGAGGQVVPTEPETEGVGKMRRGEVVWERGAVGGGGGHTLASVIKCWVLACRQTMS